MTPYRLPLPRPYSAGGVWLWGVIAELLTLLVGPWAATQYMAAQYYYASWLGKPWVVLIVPIYKPWQFFLWLWQWFSVKAMEDIFLTGLDILIIAHAAPLVSLLVYVRRSRQFAGETDLHGSARWATKEEIEKAGLFQ